MTVMDVGFLYGYALHSDQRHYSLNGIYRFYYGGAQNCQSVFLIEQK